MSTIERPPSPTRLPADYPTELLEAEQQIHLTSRDMGALRGEYAANVARLRDAYDPKARPHLLAVHMNNFYVDALQMEADWLERKVAVMEARGPQFSDARDMASARQQILDGIVHGVDECVASMTALPRAELALLRGYENPPPLVLSTLLTAMEIRGDDEVTWAAARVVLLETYYYAFFPGKCKQQLKRDLSAAQVAALERYLLDPDTLPAAAERISPACAPIAKWLRYLHLHRTAAAFTQPTFESFDGVKGRLAALHHRMSRRLDDVKEARERIAALDEELRQRVLELRERYDATLVPVQDEFFNAHDRFCDTVTRCLSPRRHAGGPTDDNNAIGELPAIGRDHTALD